MHILFVTDYLPYPPTSGDRIRVLNIAKRVAKMHDISIAAPVRNLVEAQGIEATREICRRVEVADLPRKHPMRHIPGLVRFSFQGKPLELHFLYSKELESKITDILVSENVDIIHFEHSRMAHYVSAIPKNSTVKTVLTFHNIAYQQFDTIYKVIHAPIPKFRAWLFSRQMYRWEPHCIETLDRCITVSKNDRQLLLNGKNGEVIDVVPNGVDTKINQPLAREDLQPTLLLIGLMSYAPYADSALYFCEKILPIVKEKVRNLRVFIVGSNPPEKVKQIHGDGIIVTGFVPEVAPYYRQSTISIVPLRAGGGTRLKILESMAYGRPVVSTSLGCEGLEVKDMEHLLVADTPKKFAENIIYLLEDHALYEKITADARRLVEKQYDWDMIAQKMLSIYDELVTK